ncbi:hypothetical protein [Evansella cellulosilytica]|uniref:Uncharacterized protein n=1 Tax=Evansella cellulosilytica (strain ATCC 21833 / DSM 2522 / FERM P-1141 / JCM 9156 / N-4) TaxID=649639 RepID=E6TVG3_EVAC2|nr:hypothetical protein [Evansella cellulosilytica]ADU30980.1 hypothetical protein Bcell_2725 [Evansella cellulosilytica DSM 2522]
MNIEDILSPINAPVVPIYYTGNEKTYVTYLEYNQQGAAFADDKEKQTAFSYQINIYAPYKADDLVNQVKGLLINAGLTRTFEAEEYSEQTNLYQKVIRFSYSTENEG